MRLILLVLDLVFVTDPSIATVFKSSDTLSKVDKSHYPFDLFIEGVKFDEDHDIAIENETVFAFHKAYFQALSDYIDGRDFLGFLIVLKILIS